MQVGSTTPSGEAAAGGEWAGGGQAEEMVAHPRGGAANPTPKQVSMARAQCSEQALEPQGGHTRALDVAGFAAVPPSKPQSLTWRLGSSQHIFR